MPEIDRERLRRAFDTSHFNLNAVLRGVQLTLVGGEPQLPKRSFSLGTDHRSLQPTERFRTRPFSRLITTGKLPSQLPRA